MQTEQEKRREDNGGTFWEWFLALLICGLIVAAIWGIDKIAAAQWPSL